MACRCSLRVVAPFFVLWLVALPTFGQNGIVPVEVGSTPRVTVWQDSIYFAGQPEADDFALFAQRGVKTVINLRREDEMERLGFDERANVEAKGMRYVQIPIGADEPTEESLTRLMDLLAGGEKEEPILLHCASSNRVGYIWALYEGVRQGKTVDEAVAAGKAAGLRSPALESRVRGYLAEHQQ